jgi:predicted DNA-binding transcriptional regulator YafY
VPDPVTDLVYARLVDTAARRENLIRIMRRRGHTTVSELARDLSVSRRTALRDLMALRDRGFVILAESGPGGGVSIDPSSVLVAAQLAADEVVALVLSVAMIRAAPWMPFATRADTALSKIEAALPAERVGQLRRLMERILIGDPLHDVSLSVGRVDPDLLQRFERAFSQNRVLCFDYRDRYARTSHRRVEPHALLVRAPVWYVVAWDTQKDEPRTFRMDRMTSPIVLDNVPFLPRPFDTLIGVCPDAFAAFG